MEFANYKYETFLALEALEQASMERYLNECLLLSENKLTIDSLTSLNESFGEKVKNGISKFVNAIVVLWNKFLENMNTLVKNDKAYLEKYKDIILTKKLNDVKYSMYDYPNKMKTLLSAQIPAFNYSTMKDKLVDKKTFIQSQPVFANIVGNSEDENITQLAVTAFKGDKEIEFNSNTINMTDIYNYCYNYKETAKVIQKDINTVEKAGRDAIALVEKMVRDKKITNENVLFTARTAYSMVFESVLNEVEIEDNSSENKDSSKVTAGNGSTANPAKEVAKVGDDKTGKDTKEEDIDTDKTAKDTEAQIKVYLDVCGAVLAAKKTVAEQCYKDYMSIIKYHVRSLVGKKKAENKPKDLATSQKDDSVNKGSDEKKPEEVKANEVK